MEDSFLYDERCPGQEVWFDYPDAAAHEDALVEDKLAFQRAPVTLKQNDQLMEFRKYSGVRDEKEAHVSGAGHFVGHSRANRQPT